MFLGAGMDIDDGRHAWNDFDDSVEPPSCAQELRAAIDAVVPRVYGARHSRSSVYTGAGGVCWMMLRLGCHGLAIEGAQAAAEEALRRAMRDEASFREDRVTMLEGASGNLALQVWAHVALGDRPAAEACASRLSHVAQHVSRLPQGECEVLYGRCGFLGAVLFVRRLLGQAAFLRDVVAEVVKEVLSVGRAAAASVPEAQGWPLYYEWHGKCYFGGAHGIAGILLTLLQLPEELNSACADSRELVRATADRLLSQRFDSGNLPSSLGSGRDKLVQWCHGATGLVALLVKLGELYPDNNYMLVATQVGEVVWKRGLLIAKGPGICHGAAGSGYALLVLHRATGDALWLHRAQCVGVFAARHEERLTGLADHPFSLFEGMGGAVCLWIDVLHASRRAAEGMTSDVLFPCYEF